MIGNAKLLKQVTELINIYNILTIPCYQKGSFANAWDE